jgi:hypothetical protein
MRTQKVLRTITILTIFAVACAVTAWAVAAVGQPATRSTIQQEAKSKRKTLKELAKERDVEYTSERESEVEFGDPLSVARYAHAIVLGRVTKTESYFGDTDDYIMTRYHVDVRRVLKDGSSEVITQLRPGQEPPVPPSTSLTFVREGGVVSVNGHKAVSNVKGRELLKAGDEYVLFLEWSPDFKSYKIMGGISGAVLVDSNRLVKPLGSSEDARKKYEGHDLEEFINKLSLALR